MDVLVTCKYEEDPIKNERARGVTTLYSNFSDAQGQITLVLVLVSGPRAANLMQPIPHPNDGSVKISLRLAPGFSLSLKKGRFCP